MRIELQREHLLIGSVNCGYDVAVGRRMNFNAAFCHRISRQDGRGNRMWLSVPNFMSIERHKDQTQLARDLMDTSHNLRHLIMHVMTRACQLLHVSATLVLLTAAVLFVTQKPHLATHMTASFSRLRMQTYVEAYKF
jgi:hypothetical protein